MAEHLNPTGYKGRFKLSDVTAAGYEEDQFLSWMRGQGTAVDPNTGEELYFEGDVKRFAREHSASLS